VRRSSLVLAGVLLAAGAATGHAHPGRLDARGCHQVRRDWTGPSGTGARRGEHHCHRPLGRGFRLDGREVLRDAPGEGSGREARDDRAREREQP
jgi:hypothetical protein